MVRVFIEKNALVCDASNIKSLKKELSGKLNVPPSSFFFLSKSGKLATDGDFGSSDLSLSWRVVGGKGGFGSMLRAIGAQIEKTTNREACRDLSGRRIRDINEEKRLKTAIEKKKNEKQEDPDEKFQKKIGKLLAVPKKEFKDAEYDELRSNLTENITDSLEQGMKKAKKAETVLSSVGLKRKSGNVKNKPVKKFKGAVWIDEGISSGDDSSDFEEGEPSSGKK